MSNPTIDEILDSEWYREPLPGYFDDDYDDDDLSFLDEYNNQSDDFDE